MFVSFSRSSLWAQTRLVSGFATFAQNERTHYEVLGVKRTASKDEIKDAYLRLTKELHPDKHSNNSSDRNRQNHHQQFVELNAAYGVLSKPKEKRLYDLSLKNTPNQEWESSKKRTQYTYTESTFEERARSYGYEVDKDFYKKNSNHNKVAIGCVALMIIAYLSQTFLAHMTQSWLNSSSTQISKDAKKREDRSSTIGKEAVMNKLHIEHQRQQEKFQDRKRVYEETISPE